MQSIQFWKSWAKPYQILFWFCAFTASVAILFFWYSWFIQPSPVITWEHYQQFRLQSFPLYNFSKGIFDLTVPADNHFVYEHILPGAFLPSAFSFYFLLATITVAFVILFSIITTLSRYWFLGGMVLFILFIISLRLEAVEVFGITNKIFTIIALILFGGTAFYINTFRTDIPFIKRVSAFAGLTILMAIVIIFYSHVQDPLLHIAVNGLIPGMLITLIFILMAANEILASLVWLATQRTRKSKSLTNFLIIAAVYLLNISLAYAIRIGAVRWDVTIINMFFLLTLSAVLAVWGFRQREPQYESIIPANPIGVFLILSLIIVSFGVISFLVSTASDTMMQTLQDMVLFSNLGYGVIFFVYIMVNFGTMLANNLAVYKILFKPNSMPYFTARMMGLIGTFVCLSFATNWQSSVDKAGAAYYNAYGDIYYLRGNDVLAEAYYNKSIENRNQNHHAHYALASIFTARLDPASEKEEYSKAVESAATPQAYMSLSDAYQQGGNWLESLLVLEEGIKKFPKNGILKNALGLVQAQMQLPDSALFYFQQARKAHDVKEQADINFLGISAQSKSAFPADSLLLLLDSDKPGAKANALAMANKQHHGLDIDFKLANDTTLSVYTAVLLCNELINQKDNIDTTVIAQIASLARRPINLNFREALLVAASQAWYAHGQVKRASETMRELAYLTGNGKYFQLLGLWMIEQNNAATAANYFTISADKEMPLARLYKAMAETESGNYTEAAAQWSNLPAEQDSLVSEKIQNALKSSPAEAMSLNDEEKYSFCRYKIALTDTVLFIKVAGSIGKPEWKAKAIYDRAQKWFEQDEAAIAIHYLNALRGVTFQNKNLYDDVTRLSALLTADQQNWAVLQPQLDKITFETFHRNEKVYMEALLDEAKGKDAEAKKKYQYLAEANVQFEEGLIASSRFLAKDTTDRLKPYTILVNGLLAKPNSIKLLKAYVKYAAFLGFDDEAQKSLDKLKTLLPPVSFRRYVRENPDFFSIE